MRISLYDPDGNETSFARVADAQEAPSEAMVLLAHFGRIDPVPCLSLTTTILGVCQTRQRLSAPAISAALQADWSSARTLSPASNRYPRGTCGLRRGFADTSSTSAGS
jgi:hypothetical protein